MGTCTPAGIIKNLLAKAFGTGLTQNIEDACRYLMNSCRPGDRIYNKNYNRKTAAAFKQTYCRKCVPCFIGVWDTVASLGYFLGKKFFDDKLHGKITYGYQAAAIDEKRKSSR